jgi:hypothetical protein
MVVSWMTSWGGHWERDGDTVLRNVFSMSAEWLNRMWSVHTVEYYSVMKRNQWNTMLSDPSLDHVTTV